MFSCYTNTYLACHSLSDQLTQTLHRLPVFRLILIQAEIDTNKVSVGFGAAKQWARGNVDFLLLRLLVQGHRIALLG